MVQENGFREDSPITADPRMQELQRIRREAANESEKYFLRIFFLSGGSVEHNFKK